MSHRSREGLYRRPSLRSRSVLVVPALVVKTIDRQTAVDATNRYSFRVRGQSLAAGSSSLSLSPLAAQPLVEPLADPLSTGELNSFFNSTYPVPDYSPD